jgi:hypothetical protein
MVAGRLGTAGSENQGKQERGQSIHVY